MSLFNFGRELGGALGVAFCSALFYLGFSLVYIGMSALAVVAMILTAWRLRKDALKGH
ncbi:multidrug transporter%2C putative [Vibrio cholerae]|nr:multidrug transporter%2C putative [Vibrio cholerae]